MPSSGQIVLVRIIKSAFLTMSYFWLTSLALAQQSQVKFLPLEIDSQWTYLFSHSDATNPDTDDAVYFTIDTTQIVNDTLYHRVNEHIIYFGIQLVRLDGAGNVWARYDDQDFLMLDFSLAEGDTYSFPNPENPTSQVDVTIDRDVTSPVFAGTFDGSLRMYFDDVSGRDDERSYTFSPDIGVSKINFRFAQYELYRVIIGGQIVVGLQNPRLPSVANPVVNVFPNPAGSTVSIRIGNDNQQNATTYVYNSAGKRVAISRMKCEPKQCGVDINVKALVPGIYHGAIEGDFGLFSTFLFVVLRE